MQNLQSNPEERLNKETAKLKSYISTMFQKDFESLIIVHSGGQVRRCPAEIDWIHINTLGQQQPYSLTVPWRQKEVLAQTPIQVQQGLLESKNNSWTVMNVL